jgi:hypothetical protein
MIATPVAHPAMPKHAARSVAPMEESNGESHQSVDELLAMEMSRLSLQEQYQVDLDVKGRNMLAAIEPAELSSMGLRALEDELKTRKDMKFYNLAMSLNSEMVQSREFKLKFARTECWDQQKAALRMEKYLELVYESFGQQGLLRLIRLSDLDKVRAKKSVIWRK